MSHNKLMVAAAAVAGLVFFRLIPHPPNFTPILSAGILSGLFLGRQRLAWLVPLAAMLISDVVLGMHGLLWFVYGAIAATFWIGCQLRSEAKSGELALASIGASLLFFVTTNFGVWITSSFYPHTMEGLVACYTAALPFFARTLVSTIGYTVVGAALIRALQEKMELSWRSN